MTGRGLFLPEANDGARTFSSGKNDGARTFSKEKNDGAETFSGKENDGAETFLGPKKNPLPGGRSGKFCPVPKYIQTWYMIHRYMWVVGLWAVWFFIHIHTYTHTFIHVI